MNHRILILVNMASIVLSGSLIAQSSEAVYYDGAQKLTSIYNKPERERHDKAGILILPAWRGIQDHERQVASSLSQEGYHVLVADIYGEGNYPKDAKEASAISGHYKKNVGAYRNRIRVALDELVKMGASKGQIVVIGYCFGGTGALETARANMPVRGVVSFHGGLGRDTTIEIQPIQPRVLVCHGADDPFVKVQEIADFQQEMREAGTDWQMNYYANAVHSFTSKAAGNDNTKGAAYNEKADKRSWRDFMTFLDEIWH